MVTEGILFIFVKLAQLILNLLPSLSIDFSSSFLSGLSNLTQGIAYFIPVPALVTVGSVFLSYNCFRIAVAVIMRLKSFLPNMGN